MAVAELIKLVGGPMDGSQVEAGEVVDGVLRKGIKYKIHDYGTGDPGMLIWRWAKGEYKDCDVVYKMDGDKLVFSHREGDPGL